MVEFCDCLALTALEILADVMTFGGCDCADTSDLTRLAI